MPAGSLALYRLHARTCPHRSKGRRWTRCNCAVWAQGSLGGKWIKRSLNTRDWTVAAGTIHEWEAARAIGGKRSTIPTIQEALEKYFDDAEARHLAKSTIRKRRELLEGKLLPYCESKGYQQLIDLNVDALRGFRKTWKFAATSAVKRLEYLRGFLRFCEESEWIERNPAKAIKPPKVSHKPTMPFEEPEIERTLKAAEQLSEWGSFGPKLKAMVLLLRHSGLRIQDAACLERARLKDDKLFLYTQKTGTPVSCPLPPQVVELLESQQNEAPSISSGMARANARRPSRAGIACSRSYLQPPTLRLLAATLIDSETPSRSPSAQRRRVVDVSILLGHSSVRVTERHYSPG